MGSNRNTYSQFPRTRGRSSLSRSRGERKTQCYEEKNEKNVLKLTEKNSVSIKRWLPSSRIFFKETCDLLVFAHGVERHYRVKVCADVQCLHVILQQTLHLLL